MVNPRTVLVTGASRGIGLEMIKQLAKLENGPVHIFAACRTPNSATDLQAIAKAHRQVHLIKLDTTDDASISSAVDQVSAILKSTDDGLNLLINNAAIGEQRLVNGPSSFPTAERAVFQEHFDCNSTGVAMVTQAFLPLLKKASSMSNSAKMGAGKAAIVNISSGGGSIGDNTTGSSTVRNLAYRMSKSALNQLTKTLAVDLEKDGILVVSFCPGWVQTDMGGSDAKLTPQQSVSTILSSTFQVTNEHTGGFFRGTQRLPY